MNKYIIGVDVGGTNTKFGLVNPQGKIVARSRLKTKSFNRNKKIFIRAIADTIGKLIRAHGLKREGILGIGMGWPGFIDPHKGVIRFLPNIPGWKNVALASLLQKRTKIPVFIDNDVNLITLAEWQKGAGKGAKHLICLTLGTGVGAGLILDGALYRGADFTAGEIGHIPYLDKTLELYIGNAALQARAARKFGKSRRHTEDVHALARQGNKAAQRFWDEFGEHLGFVLAGAVNLINPQRIIIGGGVSNNFDLFAASLRRTVKAKSILPAGRSLKIVRAQLDDDAGIIGAGFLVKECRKIKF